MQDTSVPIAQSNAYPRRKFTVNECVFLTANGLLEPGKFELLEGDIVFKRNKSYAHPIAVSLLVRALGAEFGMLALRHNAGIGIGELDPYNDPEPDVSVLRGSVRDYAHREPDLLTEVLLVAEAADVNLEGDRSVKARIYACHGIQEYWLVDIQNRRLIIFRDPICGTYTSIIEHDDTAIVSPLAAPNATIRVADLLP